MIVLINEPKTDTEWGKWYHKTVTMTTELSMMYVVLIWVSLLFCDYYYCDLRVCHFNEFLTCKNVANNLIMFCCI